MTNQVVLLIIGLVIGGVVGWLLANARRGADEVRLEEARRQLEEQKGLLGDAKQQFGDAFKALSSDALRNSNQAFLQLAKTTLNAVIAEARGDVDKRKEAIDGLIRPLQDALNRYEEQIKGMEERRQQAYGSLDTQLKSVASTQQQLQRETANLVTALRTPQVRGRWGEMTLHRVVEMTGLSEYCDFDRQVSVTTDDGRLRPDMVVRLPGDRSIVVDAKTPLDAYLVACEAADEDARREAMSRHADQLRKHIQQVSSKTYWSQFSRTPDFVVLFIPGECFFSAALMEDRELLDDGIQNKVLLATPVTLVALLKSVALSWQEERVVQNAQQIAQASHELFDRICVFARHLAKVGDGLEKAAKAYNDAVGSWQSRVLTQGSRVVALAGTRQGSELPELNTVDEAIRQLPATSEGAAES
jgi:DNA recombination protein RmuC